MENAIKYIEDYYRQTAKIKHESYLSDAREIGKTEGITIGRTEGIAIGKNEGIRTAECNIVKNMHDNNMNEEDIAKVTNIPLKRVKKMLLL